MREARVRILTLDVELGARQLIASLMDADTGEILAIERASHVAQPEPRLSEPLACGRVLAVVVRLRWAHERARRLGLQALRFRSRDSIVGQLAICTRSDPIELMRRERKTSVLMGVFERLARYVKGDSDCESQKE